MAGAPAPSQSTAQATITSIATGASIAAGAAIRAAVAFIAAASAEFAAHNETRIRPGAPADRELQAVLGKGNLLLARAD